MVPFLKVKVEHLSLNDFFAQTGVEVCFRLCDKARSIVNSDIVNEAAPLAHSLSKKLYGHDK